MVMKVLPVVFGLISLSFPAGLVLYFFVSNLWRLGQQEVIFTRHGHELHGGGKGAKDKAIDVDSKDRSKGKASTAMLAPPEESPRRGAGARPRRSAEPEARPAPGAAAAGQVPGEGRRPGGLRGMFALPPPPEGNGGGPSSGSRPNGGSGSTGSGGSGRPPPQRRRSNKKKRKR